MAARPILALLMVFIAASMVEADPAPAPKLTSRQIEKLKERSRLATEAGQLNSQGKYAEAIARVEKCLAIEREVFGPDHLSVDRSLGFLAELNENLRNFAAATRYRRDLLARLVKRNGADHWQTVDARLRLEDIAVFAKWSADQWQQLKRAWQDNERAILLYQQGNYADALPRFVAAMEVKRQLLGEKHPDYASALSNLAALYLAQGDTIRGESLARRAVEVLRQALGQTNPRFASALTTLAKAYWMQGDYGRTESLCRQAADAYRQCLGEKHYRYARGLHNLALLYEQQKDYAKAEALYRQTLEIRRQSVGEKSPDYAASLNNLAGVYRAQGDFAKAEPLLRQAVQIRQAVLGKNHPEYAASVLNLAILYRSQGDFAKAEPLCRQALEVFRQSLGETHSYYAGCLRALAELEHAQGKTAQAAPLFRQALEIVRKNMELSAAGQSERQQRVMASSMEVYLHSYLTISSGAALPARASYGPVLFWKDVTLARRYHTQIDASDPNLVKLADDLRRTTVQLATLSFAVPDPRQREAFNRQIAAMSDRKERLEQQLAQQSGAFRRRQESTRLTPEQLQKLLPPGTALVDFLDYWHGTPREKTASPNPSAG